MFPDVQTEHPLMQPCAVDLGLLSFDRTADWLLKNPKVVKLSIHEQPSDSFRWRDDIQAQWKASGSALSIFSLYNFLQQMITQSVSHMFPYLRKLFQSLL